MIKIKKYGIILITALICSQVHYGLTTTAGEKDNSLTIRHIAKSPDGVTRELGIEKIENIPDVYYYRAAVSPVASKLLENGYKLADEKNSLIEADVVSNGGKLDLEYTPELQTVTVTYYKVDGESEKEMGSITDSAYVGSEYKPLLPLYEEEDVLTALIGDETHIVGLGDNNFKASYTVEKKPEQGSGKREGASGGGKGARLTNVYLNTGDGYITGYADNTFRPENEISKKELLTILYSISGGNLQKDVSFHEGLAFLKETGIVPEDETGSEDFVTWNEFLGYMERLNTQLLQKDKIEALYSDYWTFYFEGDRHIKRSEAVVVINEMTGMRKRGSKIAGAHITRNTFSDVREDYWAYKEIMDAAR